MSEWIVKENGHTYIEDDHGNRREPSFGQSVYEDAVGFLPLATKTASFMLRKTSDIMLNAAGNVLTEEELSQLKEKQEKQDNSLLSKVVPKDLGNAINAEKKVNQAIFAMGKHFIKKTVSGAKKIMNKEEDS